MINIQLDLSGATNLINGSRLLRNSIAKAAEDSAIYANNQLKRYPRQPIGVTYRRTNTAKRAWGYEVITTTSTPSSRVASNGNIAPYNRFIQDESRRNRRMPHWRNFTVQAYRDDFEEQAFDFYRTRIRREFELT